MAVGAVSQELLWTAHLREGGRPESFRVILLTLPVLFPPASSTLGHGVPNLSGPNVSPSARLPLPSNQAPLLCFPRRRGLSLRASAGLSVQRLPLQPV